MSDPAFRRMSVEEYLRTEPHSPVKREDVNGFVYPLHGQAGVSDAHDSIVVNVLLAVGPLARRVGCRAYTADMRMRSADGQSYFSPDTTVTCTPREDGV
ncbi:Uma2 family endonuclease [Deinococcus planocerae]|uniref:Uma2 family endonuclease n=1 Tax=Deinococcus planocerae TaxID=1737569 RepID=UPI000C7F6FB1